jgi:hypothetical protein
VVAHVVDLHDVRVPQTRYCFCLAQEPREFMRPGVRAAEEHLERNGAVEAQVPGLVDDAHAAAAEDRLDLVTRDLRQGRLVRWVYGRLGGGREEGVEVGPEAAHLPPAVADHRQQLGARRADLLRRDLRVKELVKQLLDARVVGHGATSRGSRRVWRARFSEQ